MKKLKFRYALRIEFDMPVTQHSFTVRCLPVSDERQAILQQNIHILPKEFLSENRDSFGNIYFFGRTEAPHNLFEVVTEGIAQTGLAKGTKAEEEYRLGMFLGQTFYTKPDEALKAFFDGMKIPAGTRLQKSQFIMEAIREKFAYVSGVTNISTTAAQAWKMKQGVCQDYSHIMLSLCRMAGIPCRYVAGMLIGEGLSHAWVEIEEDGMWYGLDPTNGTEVLEDHIKISHGRDYEDCLINQGVFTGLAKQSQSISVSVMEEVEEKKEGKEKHDHINSQCTSSSR